jgi:hypothetical protein
MYTHAQLQAAVDIASGIFRNALARTRVLRDNTQARVTASGPTDPATNPPPLLHYCYETGAPAPWVVLTRRRPFNLRVYPSRFLTT